MSARGRGAGPGAGHSAGRGGRGGGRPGGRPDRRDQGDLLNPDSMVEYGTYLHPAGNDMVFKALDCAKIPKFNSPIFLPNKTHIGNLDEIFGPVNEVVRTAIILDQTRYLKLTYFCLTRLAICLSLLKYFSVKPKAGFNAGSFAKNGKVCLGSDRFLDAWRFLNPPKAGGRGPKGQRQGGGGRPGGANRGGPRVSRGGFQRGGSSGFNRGGSNRGGGDGGHSRGGRGSGAANRGRGN